MSTQYTVHSTYSLFVDQAGAEALADGDHGAHGGGGEARTGLRTCILAQTSADIKLDTFLWHYLYVRKVTFIIHSRLKVFDD